MFIRCSCVVDEDVSGEFICQSGIVLQLEFGLNALFIIKMSPFLEVYHCTRAPFRRQAH